MGETRLDVETADMILAGTADPADVPPGFEAVVALIATVRRPHAPVSPAVAGRTPVPLRPRRRFMLVTTPFRSRLTIVAAAAALAAASGTAYAAGVPRAASAAASGVLRSLGIEAGAPAGTHSPPSGTHGAAVSGVAHTTTGTGARLGAQIGPIARDGRSHAGRRDGTSAATKGDAGKARSTLRHGTEIAALAHATTGTAGAKGATISATASGGRSHAGEHGHNGKSGSSHGSAATAGTHSGHSGGGGPGKGPGGS